MKFYLCDHEAFHSPIFYGLGHRERTSIYFSYEEAGGETQAANIAILQITGGKIDRWMNFARNFKPTR
ncbi:hypothetical protein [Phormidesmis priestleyi]